MNRIQITKNFFLDEFVPKEIYNAFGEKSIWFVENKTINTIQAIRDYVGKSITINNWVHGGSFNNRGFRHPSTNVGGVLSQHKLKCAIDFNVEGMNDNEVDEMIIKQFNRFKSYGLTTIENPAFTKGWTHIDTRVTNLDKILIVNP